MSEIVDKWNPTVAQKKRWAFDLNFELMTEEMHDECYGNFDEYDFFSEEEHQELLLLFANDPNCVRSKEILKVLDYYANQSFLASIQERTDWISIALKTARKLESHSIKKWYNKQLRKLKIWRGIGSVNKHQAIGIANLFLNGYCRHIVLEHYLERQDCWVIRLSVPSTPDYEEFFVVNKKNGRFVYYKYGLEENYTSDPIVKEAEILKSLHESEWIS